MMLADRPQRLLSAHRRSRGLRVLLVAEQAPGSSFGPTQPRTIWIKRNSVATFSVHYEEGPVLQSTVPFVASEGPGTIVQEKLKQLACMNRFPSEVVPKASGF